MPGREELIETRQQVVAGDDADFQLAARTLRARNLEHGLRAGDWIYAAGVGDHFHPALGHAGQHTFHRAKEVARVAHRRVALLLFLQDRHRDFGEVVEHEIIDRSPLDLSPRRVEPVAPEPLPRCHPNDAIGIHGVRLSSCVREERMPQDVDRGSTVLHAARER